MIYGGSGNDTIYGGDGSDVLLGGAGNDTYYLYATDLGQDRIEDKEGDNTLVINGNAVKFFVRKNGETDYHTADNRITAVMQGTDLVVTDQTGTSVILNEDFQNGDFGIQLIDLALEPGQDLPSITDITTDPGGTRTTFRGTAAADSTQGSGIDDDIFGNGGGDRLEGGGGDDLIISGNTLPNAYLDGGSPDLSVFQSIVVQGTVEDDAGYFDTGLSQDMAGGQVLRANISGYAALGVTQSIHKFQKIEYFEYFKKGA